MRSQIKVRPEDLIRLGDRCIDLAADLTGAAVDAGSGLEVGDRDAGDTQGGFETTAAHPPLAEAATDAIQSLAAVLEADSDALMQCAFDVSQTDEDTARRARHSDSAPPGPTPTPQPVPAPRQPEPTPSPSPGPSPTPPGDRLAGRLGDA